MGDPQREAAFDAAYATFGDVGAAEDYANEAMARRRSRRLAIIVAAAAGVLLALAAAVAVARSGGGGSSTAEAVGVPIVGGVVQSTAVPTTTSTTAVLMQPPLALAPTAAPTPTTAAAVRPPSPAATTTTVAAQPDDAPVGQNATLTEVWPTDRDPGRVYVSARGRDLGSYVDRMTIDWGDGTATTDVDYPLSSCRPGASQSVDANHAYATPGIYAVRLFVTSVACDGTAARLATAATSVSYPSSPPAG